MGIEEELQNEKEKVQNSRDFKEITLAIALLGGLLAFLFKLISYFNENIILWSESTQIDAYFLVGALLLEFIIIFLFFILKGISLSTKKRRGELEDITAGLFKVSFIFPLLWFVASILSLLFYYIIQNFNMNFYISIGYFFLIFILDFILLVELLGIENLKKADIIFLEKIKSTKLQLVLLIIITLILLILFYYIINDINRYISTVYIFLNLIIVCILFVNLWGREELKKEFNTINLKIKNTNLKPLIVRLIILFIILIIFSPAYLKLYSDIFSVAPSILLMGSFSIEEFPQSIDNGDILTFTIKETGLTSHVSFINLYKLNAGNNSLEPIDNITIPLQNKSIKELMFGGVHETNYYLNLNTSNLSSGNYMMHAEVTNDLTKKSIFGDIKKHDDKLFYIAPRSANYSFYSAQELKGNLTQ